MIATLTPVPTTPPAAMQTQDTPVPEALNARFTALADLLQRTDDTLTSMTTGRNPVGDGWSAHMGQLATTLQGVRDEFLAAKPEAKELSAGLGTSVIGIASSSGSLGVMARNRMVLSEGWAAFLDKPIAEAREAAALLTKGAEPTPNPNPAPNPDPAPAPAPVSPQVAADVTAAIDLINQSIEQINTVPVSDRGDASTKDARIAAYNLNMDAQKLLEQHFDGDDAATVSKLRTADASLEDSNWQLAKKPSPDGRFNGVDIPGALRDAQSAADTLTTLVAGAPAAELAAPAAPAGGAQFDSGPRPGDADYCRTPEFSGGFGGFH